MQRARFPSMPSTQGPSARWRRRTRESDPPCRRIRTIARRHPRSSFVRRRGVFPSGAGRAGAGSPCAPPAGGGTGRGNAARVASRRPPLEESGGAELLVQMSTTVKHPTLRLGVELAIGRGVDAPLGLQLSEARPDRPDPENPPPLPWEAGVRRTFTAPDAPPAALVPLACALLGAPPGHADCRSLRNRVPAVDELPHGIPRDGIGEVVLTGGIVRDPHPALPAFQEVGGDSTNELEVHHSSPRLRTRSPSSSAASRMCSRFRPPTPPAIRTAHTFASTPFSSAAVWTTTSRNPLGWRPRAVFGPRKPMDTTLIRHPMCRRSFDWPPWGFRHLRPSLGCRNHSWR